MVKVEKITQAREHKGALYRIEAFKDGTFITAGSDGIIAQWQSLDKTPVAIASIQQQIFSLAYSAERNQLVAGVMHGGLHVINTLSRVEEHHIQYKQAIIYDVLYIGDMAVTAHGNGELVLWHLPSWEILSALQVSTAAIRCVISGDEHTLYCGDSEGNITQLSISTNKLAVVKRWQANTLSIFTLMYIADSPARAGLVSGGRNAALTIWDTGTYLPIHSIPAHLSTINHIISLNPLPVWATASRDKTIKLWQAGTGKLLKVIDATKFSTHIHSVNRLLWQPGSKCLYSCGDDAAIMAWHIDI